jgi:RNA polymerase sigma-70 factor (ECF subfamily)
MFLNSATAGTNQGVEDASERLLVQTSDIELMERVKLGDRSSLGLLFERYARVVFAVSERILRNSTEAQDLLQEVFLYVHQKSNLFKAEKGSVASWLLRITYSRAFDRREYLNVRGWCDDTEIEEIANSTRSDSSLDVLNDSVLAKEILERGLADLTYRQRLTLEMYFFEGYTLREISAKLDESIVNTRHHYYRGIERLRAVVVDHHSRKAAAD